MVKILKLVIMAIALEEMKDYCFFVSLAASFPIISGDVPE